MPRGRPWLSAQGSSSFVRALTAPRRGGGPGRHPPWGKTVAQAQKAYEKAKRR